MAKETQSLLNVLTVQKRDRQGQDSRAQELNGAHALSAVGSDATYSAAFHSVARGAIM